MRKLRLKNRKLEVSNPPLLELAKSLNYDADLKDVYLIAQQHIVPTTFNMFQALCDLGLQANNISLIGKCYSTDIETFDRFRDMGVYVCDSSHKFESLLSFDSFYADNLEKFLRRCNARISQKNIRKVIILDDGGDLLIIAKKMVSPHLKIVGLEQTSSGYNKLVNHGIKFPVINIARSKAKLEYETPIIAELSVRRLTARIKKLPQKIEDVLIIGGGVIGAAFFKKLSAKYNVEIYDKNPEKSSMTPEQFERSLDKFDLIIGCVGEQVFTAEDFKKLKQDVILASASSSDREFNAVHLRTQISQTINCHQDITVGGVHLLNCGFPLTFDSIYDPWDQPLLEKLLLTRSLILSGVCQASSGFDLPPVFVELNEVNQEKIVASFLAMYP